jgi:hypothetical protein
MIKLVFAWKDNPDKTPEECEAHYRKVHMELAKQVYTGAEGFIAIAYNRVKKHSVNDFNQPNLIATPSDIDAYVELWYEDQASLEKAMGHPVLQQMWADHPNFMACDVPASVRVYEVDETVYLGHRPG